jgi:hypothetical protein
MRLRYPYSETVILFSGDPSKSNIKDYVELQEYLQQFSETTDEPLVQRLLPVNSLNPLIVRDEIFLESVEFAGFDMADNQLEVGDTQTEMLGGRVIKDLWQPNFFRPIVRIGGENVTSGVNNPMGDSVFHDKGIGFPLPFCVPVNKQITNTTDIKITASYAQGFLDGGAYKFKNYALMAIVSFWHDMSQTNC